jgi:hypothetical protein
MSCVYVQQWKDTSRTTSLRDDRISAMLLLKVVQEQRITLPDRMASFHA